MEQVFTEFKWKILEPISSPSLAEPALGKGEAETLYWASRKACAVVLHNHKAEQIATARGLLVLHPLTLVVHLLHRGHISRTQYQRAIEQFAFLVNMEETVKQRWLDLGERSN